MPDAWVYLLRCRDASLYTGWTVDVQRRLARHQAGVASRYTASRLPVELVLAIPMADKSADRREEARIKRLPRVAKLALIADQREAVVLKIYQGFKFEEMSEILSCPVSTIKSRLYTALELLKTELAPMKARGLS